MPTAPRHSLPTWLTVALVFALDLSVPPGGATGSLYSLVVLISLRHADPRLSLRLGLVCTALLVATTLLRPESAVPLWVLVLNRAIGISLVWLAVAIGAQLNSSRAQLEHANRRLEELAHRDGLTGLANRRHFDTHLEAEFRRSGQAGEPLVLLLVDVDHFKRYNDTHGHQAGDEALARVAQTILARTRRSGELVARYGGEEFAVILPGTDLEAAREWAEAVREAVAAIQPGGGGVTVSIGLAARHEHPNPQTLLAAADRALYTAKREGRNRTVTALAGAE